jgi:hypothetical protein
MEMDETAKLLRELAIYAEKYHDGHVTIMKFTTNWKVGFGTPSENWGYTTEEKPMKAGVTFIEAARKALADPQQEADCITNTIVYPERNYAC